MPEDQTAKRLILPHLTTAAQHLPVQTATFVELLSRYVDNPDDPSGLKLDNLRVAVKGLKGDYERLEELLARLEPKKE